MAEFKPGQFVLVKPFYHRANGETGCRVWRMVEHVPAKVARVLPDTTAVVLEYVGITLEECNCESNRQRFHAYNPEELTVGG